MQCPATVHDLCSKFSRGLQNHIYPPQPGANITACIARKENPLESAFCEMHCLDPEYQETGLTGETVK
ncbi:hypothetical protein LSH36_691g01003 [Paralvinella palmiformis]|uniref:Uncharacterized protein n=1 Tax=Paralvinella palmiformis TaxID=53620 RepID=A0AAD9J3D6_9ANNE|nr:hypothetical protein LSH36_691g01003 [Paralvinella palmiformis]